ncbi:MAG: cohesin domain-containing protein, partial [Thermodesulfobacteriota bacterium]
MFHLSFLINFRKNIKFTAFQFIIIIAFLLIPCTVLAESLSLTPQTQTVEQGEQFTVTLEVGSTTELTGASFYLDYDSILLKYTSISAGSFISNGCFTVFPLATDLPGKLIVGISRLGCAGVTGSGDIATITFDAQNQAGTSD